MEKKKVSFEELLGLGFKKMQKVSLERLHLPRAPPNPVFNEDKQEYSYEVSVDLRKGIYPDETIASEKSVDIGRSSGSTPTNYKVGTESTDSKLAIDFNNLDPKYQKWALSLETQRHYYYTKFGKVHRKDSIEVKKDLEEKELELDVVKYMKKQQKPIFMGVMNEYKNKVKKLKEKRDKDE